MPLAQALAACEMININKNLFIYLIFTLSIGMSVVEVLINLQGEVVSDSTQGLWGLVFFILSILWTYYDADSKDFDKPFDFGLLIYIFWPIAFPWYLISTRGLEGIIIYLGFMALWLGPWLGGLVAYVYFV